MTRPTPRRSSLAGASPVTPVDAAPPAAVEAEPIAPSVPEAPAVKKPAAKYPPKVSFYQDPDNTARVRGAILHTQVSEGTRSLSAFIDQAVMEKVAALEAKYNGGKPFPAVGARELPQGRPMGD